MTIKISIDKAWVRADVIDGMRPGNVYHTARILWQPVNRQISEAVEYCRYHVKGGQDANFTSDPALKWALVEY